MRDLAVRCLKQVFTFLKELSDIRYPVPRDLTGIELLRIDDWPQHPCIGLRRGDTIAEDSQESDSAELEPLIRVRRAELTVCPPPPQSLDGWIKPGWQELEREPEVLEARNFTDAEKQTSTVRFDEDEHRSKDFKDWKAIRKAWAKAERPAVAARKLYERIYALWTMLQRDGDRVELVLSDGILNVETSGVRHPVLLQKINLHFDASAPEFHFHAGNEKVELHRSLLRLVPEIEGRMIAHFDAKLDEEPVEPLGGISTQGFFQRLAQGLFTNGEFTDRESGLKSATPCLWREPMILVRPRTAGLSSTLEFIVEDLGKEGSVPG